MIVNELVTKFSFLGSLQAQIDFNKNTGISIASIGKLAAGLATAAGAFQAWTGKVLAGLDPMIQMSRVTGVAVEDLQELGYAASVTGSSAEAMQESLRQLAQRVGEASMGLGEGRVVLQRYGVALRDEQGQVRDAAAVFEDLRQSVRDLSATERISIANKLGIKPELAQLLGKTNEEMRAMRDTAREIGVISTEQANAAAAFNDAWTTVRFAIRAFTNDLALSFAPEMKAMADGFVAWVREVRGPATVVIRRLGAMLNWVSRIARENAGTFLALGAAIALAFSPLTRTIAVLTAAWLVIDDLVVAAQGGKSAIRDFFQAWLGVDITPILQGAWAAFKGWLSDMRAAYQPLLDTIGNGLGGIVDRLKDGDWAGAWKEIKAQAALAFRLIYWNARIELHKLGMWAADWLPEPIMKGLRFAFGIGSDLWRGDFAAAWKKIEPTVIRIKDWLIKALDPVLSWLEQRLNGIWRGFLTSLNLNNLIFDLGGVDKGRQVYPDSSAYLRGALGTPAPAAGNTYQNNANFVFNTSDPVLAGTQAARLAGLSDPMRRVTEIVRRRFL